LSSKAAPDLFIETCMPGDAVVVLTAPGVICVHAARRTEQPAMRCLRERVAIPLPIAA
jgi:hypothetical protein